MGLLSARAVLLTSSQISQHGRRRVPAITLTPLGQGTFALQAWCFLFCTKRTQNERTTSICVKDIIARCILRVALAVSARSCCFDGSTLGGTGRLLRCGFGNLALARRCISRPRCAQAPLAAARLGWALRLVAGCSWSAHSEPLSVLTALTVHSVARLEPLVALFDRRVRAAEGASHLIEPAPFKQPQPQDRCVLLRRKAVISPRHVRLAAGRR